jgi:hypothetical protein
MIHEVLNHYTDYWRCYSFNIGPRSFLSYLVIENILEGNVYCFNTKLSLNTGSFQPVFFFFGSLCFLYLAEMTNIIKQ